MRFLDTPLRYWRTVRYLKPVQIYARVWHRWYRSGISMAAADPFRLSVGRWHPVPRTPRQLGPRHFRFLGVERHLSTAADWLGAGAQSLYAIRDFVEFKTIWHPVGA